MSLKLFAVCDGKPQPYPGNIHVRVTHRLNHQRKTTSLY